MMGGAACLAPRVVPSLSPRLNHDWLRYSFAACWRLAPALLGARYADLAASHHWTSRTFVAYTT